MSVVRARLLGSLSVAAVAALSLVAPAAAEGVVLGADRAEAIQGSYIVAIRDDASPRPDSARMARVLAGQYGGQVRAAWQHALNGFAVTMRADQARKLAADPRVALVQQDATVRALDIQPNPPSWGLDRVDQRDLPLNQSYVYDTTAANVTVYVVDTGIRTTHTTFGGRAVFGTNTTGDGVNSDCNGHGTHVAGTVGGAQYGVAKGVQLVAVKVLNCQGSGSTASVVAGIDWVTAHHQAGQPAVANMSLGGGVDSVLDAAVRTSIADGITFALASGNSNANACNASPARVAEAITVNSSTITDARSSFSNYGTCTDIFAPGSDITSSWSTSDIATNTISGTSMATPHVAGAAALWLAAHPGDQPAAVQTALIDNATPNKITNPGVGSPNRLLFTAPNVTGAPVVANPGSRSGSVGVATSLQLSASGGTPPYIWSATGLPPGLSVNALTGLISGTPTTAGVYSVVATARDILNVTGSASFTWTIGTGSCSGTNGMDVGIPDNATVTSSIAITGCAGNAVAGSTVEVHIQHTFIGDLVVSVVAPDGTAYLLHNRAGSGADNIDQTYTVNLSTELANGTWSLRVSDAAAADTGKIDTWTLNLGGSAPCTGTNGVDVGIPDNTTVDSAIPISGCVGSASATAKVEVHIQHTFIGDLVVSVVAPDGTAYLLHNRTGSGADNIDQVYTVNLSAEARNGTWRLRVQDAAALDTGKIDTWTLTI